MSSAPIVFGHPLWFGKIKARIAKKYLNRWHMGALRRRYLKRFENYGIGDSINDCTGFNGKLIEIVPDYRNVGKGFVLVDIDFQTTNTGCSMQSCGVEAALSREEIEARHLDFLENWFFAELGKNWYGDDPKYKPQVENARRKLETLKSGGHILDEDAQLLSEFKVSGL